MSEIDIRNKGLQEVDVIRFADDCAQVVAKGCNCVGVSDTYNEVRISDKEHAEHLITALQEAISRGWLV